MAYDKASLMKLNKVELDYLENFNGVLVALKKDVSDLKNELSGLRSYFSKLETDIQVSTNINA